MRSSQFCGRITFCSAFNFMTATNFFAHGCRRGDFFAQKEIRSPYRKIFLPSLIAVAILILFLWNPAKLFAQDAPADSAALKAAEVSAYEIDRFRLLRWVRAHQDSSGRDFLAQILDLITEADGFTRRQDYPTAQLILDTALELAGRRMETTGATKSSAPPIEPPRSNSEWRREVLFGVDLSGFEFRFADQESLYVDRDGNPFVGLRLSLNHDATPSLNTRASNLSRLSLQPEARDLNFNAYALLKFSRDYFSGEVEFNARQSLGSGSYWRIQNRLEGTSYHRDLDLQYWQNLTSALAVAELNKNFRLEVADEFRWRRYRAQNDFSPNYIQNRAGFGVVFNPAHTTRLDSRYSYTVQAHDLCPSYDYLEHRIEAAAFQKSAANSSIALENIWRNRIYPNHPTSDTCRIDLQRTYQEEYARVDLRLGLSETVALRVEGDFTLLQYKMPSTDKPNFLKTLVHPQLQFKLFADLQVSLGYLYLLRVNDKEIIQSNPVIVDRDTIPPLPPLERDYYAHGITFGVDLIRTDGLLLSAIENYEIRTYPDAPANDILNYNRNINSLLLFFSWNFRPRWQANVLANFDNDHSRVDDQRDSRNTLFTIDFGYSF